MAVLSEIAYLACDCEGGGIINTGQLGCDTPFGYPIHVLFVKNSVVIPKEADVTIDYMMDLVQRDQAIPLMNAYDSTPEVTDDTYETSTRGVDTLTLQGLKKYTFSYLKGEYFYKELSKLTSFGTYRVILGDINGNWLVAKNANGDFTGFQIGQVNALQTTDATASESRKKSVMFQLINRLELDTNYEMFLSSALFPLSDITGVNPAKLDLEDANGDVIPSEGDSTLKVKATFLNDCDEIIEGVTNFKVTINGSLVTTTTVEDGNGFYTITIPILNLEDEVRVDLWDATILKEVVNVENVLFRAETLEIAA